MKLYYAKLTLLILIIALCSTNIFAQTAVAPTNFGEAGAGSESNPYLIETWENFYWITQDPDRWDKHYRQTADIDFSDAPTDIETWDDNQGLLPIGNSTDKFTGVYDGDGYSIRGVYINRPNTEHVGLFGYVDASGIPVQNLKVYGSITGSRNVGGIAGIVERGTIQKVFFEGSVAATTTTQNALVGGISGQTKQSTISQAGAIVTLSADHDYVGGITAWCDTCVVEDSYMRGDISGKSFLGGLVAAHNVGPASVIRRSYVSANVTATAGIVGRISTSQIGSMDVYANSDKSLSGTHEITVTGTTLLTEAELKNANNLSGFDFSETWAISAGVNHGFPYLSSLFTTPLVQDPPSNLEQVPPSNFAEAGAGTVSNPYLIETWENFYWITQNSTEWDKHYRQTADIDFSDAETDIETWDDNKGLLPIGNSTDKFTGVYDGDGYSIRGVYINRPAISDVGLFGYVDASGIRVQNLKVYGSITGRDYVGGIAGVLGENSSIQKVFFEGSVVASITDGNALLGGIVGYTDHATISQAGAIVTLSSVRDYVGGIIGYCGRCVIEDSYVRGEISGRSILGGIVAAVHLEAASVIRRSYVSASITAIPGAAGRISTSQLGTEHVYANSEKPLSAAIEITVTGTTLLTEAELKNANNLSGFDFSATWAIDAGVNHGFPYLPNFPSISTELVPPSNFGEAGAGTESNPYLIETWENFYWITQNSTEWDKHYRQTADIDFNTASPVIQTWDGNKGLLPIGNSTDKFTGVYDGDGYSIRGVYINRPEISHVGLFGYVDASGIRVQNLKVYGSITGRDAVAGIAGVLWENSTIQKVFFEGSVEATITDGNALVGGIVGYTYRATIRQAGGIVNLTSVRDYVGGITGFCDRCVIEDSYVRGEITGRSHIGGLVAAHSQAASAIRRSYASASITATAGSAGRISTTQIGSVDVYANSEKTLSAATINTVTGTTLLTEAELKNANNLSGFDFQNVWIITSSLNNGFPVLRWVNKGAEKEISGLSGWYMLSLPMADVPFSQLATQNLIQGTTESGSLYDNPIYGTSAAPNLFLYDGVHQNFDPVTSLTVTPESGRGFIWYLYDNDIGPSVTLPFTLQVFGSYQDDQSVSVSIDQGWNLLGNPYTLPITISHGALNQAAGSGLVSAAAQIWTPDPAIANGGSWRLENDEILPFQGFFIENDSATELTFATLMQNTSGNSVLMNTSEKMYLDFELLTETTRDISARILFHEDATDEWDVFDASKLVPLHSQWATVSFGGNRGEAYVQKAQESRPLDLTYDISIPVYVQTYNTTGEARLSWSSLETLPESWNITLHDLHTGSMINLREEREFVFNLDDDMQLLSQNKKHSGKSVARVETPDKARFELIISPGNVTSTENMSEVPSQLELAQNFPNPFNPTTQIQFGLPENGMVRLAVYDVLGRQVATLVNQEMQAGMHQLTFDASHLASGLYVYRLQAGSDIVIRTMTLVK